MAGFVVLGSCPADGDHERALKDSHGLYLWHLMYKAGIPRKDIKIEFLWDNIYSVGSPSHKLVDIISRNKPKVIVALGSDVMKVLGIDGKLNSNRGSVYDFKGTWVVPTFQPRDLKTPYRMFAEESTEKGYYCFADIKKAVSIYRNGWQLPKERFNVEPTIEDVRAFRDMVKRDNPLLGADLEGDGLSIEHSEVWVHGFAWTEEDAICIPILREGYKRYWSPEEEREVWEILDYVYSHGRIAFQNGVGYDVPLLRARGYNMRLDNFYLDTMVMHHVLDPESPHNIGFISSIFGKTSYWKESFLSRKETIDETDQIDMRIYNCRDCTALIQIINGMNREIVSLLENDLYRRVPELIDMEMKAARVSVKMFEKGLKLDKTKLYAWRKYLVAEHTKARDALYSEFELPEEFNVNSGDHKKMWVYGELPKSLNKAELEAKLAVYDSEAHNYQYACTDCDRKVTKKFYEFEEVPQEREQRCPACKKVMKVKRTEKPRTSVKALAKDTDAYAKLAMKKVILEIEPLYKLHRYSPLPTKAGQPALDKKAIVRYLIAIDSRLDEIARMKRRLDKHREEKNKLETTRKALTLLSEYGRLEKLKSSFFTFPTWADGYVRPFALVTGTATGRWSYKRPNLQQAPHGEMGKFIRACFRADDDSVLLSGDFSNLEVQIGARLMRDTVLIDLLIDGLNLHDENTKVFFGLNASDPEFELYRRVAKIIQFARLFYGGSDRGIYTQVKTQIPECELTFKQFCEAVNNYFDSHPEYVDFVEERQRVAVEDRISINAYGRVRTLFGERNKIKRQALNSPVQGSAADAVTEDIILIDKALEDAGLRARIVLQVHDELIFNIPKNELAVAYPIIKEIMGRERVINGYKFNIPVDYEIGTHWGLQGKFDEKTFEIIGKSKH